MRWPQALKKGDRIGIVAAASGFAAERFDAGIAILRAAGFEPVFDDRVLQRYRYMAGTDAQRLAVLQQALADDSLSGIWLARGGYGCARLLPHFNVGTIGTKWLVGFSDGTALHALWHRAGCGSLHAANVTTLSDWSASARGGLFDLLADGGARIYRGVTLAGRGAVRGTLFGGNLTVLATLAGTQFWPTREGSILLIEDVDEKPYEIDRALTHLRQTGALDSVVGVAVGVLSYEKVKLQENATKPLDYTPYDVVAELLAPLGVPVLAQLPVGHHRDSEAIALGAQAVIDTDAGELRVGRVGVRD